MERYRTQVLSGSAITFLGAVVAAAVALALADPGRVLVPLTGSSLVLIGAYYFLDRPRALAVAWPAPLVAAAVVFLSPDATSVLSASATLGVLAVASAATWRVPAYFAQKGRELGDRE